MLEKLSNLNYEQLKALYKNNQYIRETVFQEAAADRYYFIENEIISYFRKYDKANSREKYAANFDEYYPGVFAVKVKQDNYKFFLECCRDIQKATEIFNPEIEEIITRLSGRAVFFESCLNGFSDISDSNFDRLETWFNAGIKKISEALRENIQAEHDCIFDYDFLLEYFGYMIELEQLENMETDGKTVYEYIPAQRIAHN